jgi:hypothetical protein
MSEETFEHDDFVFTQKTNENGETEIFGGGYKVESFFLQEGISPITTINDQFGGGDKVSSPFEHLAVPAGLFYINMKAPKRNMSEHYEEHSPISDDIMEKLYNLISADKKHQRKTKKHKPTKNLQKTRRH